MPVLQHQIAFCSRPKTASDVLSIKFMRPIVPDKCAKFGDPRLSRSAEIQIEGGISTVFRDDFRPEVDRDVISSAVVDGLVWVCT